MVHPAPPPQGQVNTLHSLHKLHIPSPPSDTPLPCQAPFQRCTGIREHRQAKQCSFCHPPPAQAAHQLGHFPHTQNSRITTARWVKGATSQKYLGTTVLFVAYELYTRSFHLLCHPRLSLLSETWRKQKPLADSWWFLQFMSVQLTLSTLD